MVVCHRQCGGLGGEAAHGGLSLHTQAGIACDTSECGKSLCS